MRNPLHLVVLSKELRPVDSPVQRDPDALTELERAELQRLRKEVIELRTDKEILKRAAAYFARETMR